jgi:hypothetical protein
MLAVEYLLYMFRIDLFLKQHSPTGLSHNRCNMLSLLRKAYFQILFKLISGFKKRYFSRLPQENSDISPSSKLPMRASDVAFQILGHPKIRPPKYLSKLCNLRLMRKYKFRSPYFLPL